MAITYSVQTPGIYRAYGLSTDTKPTSPPDNCLFFEIDTALIYASSAGVWVMKTTGSNLSLTDVTTNDATTTRHGFLPKLSGVVANSFKGDGTWATLAKSDVGLGSVDNTADTAKPVSTAQQTALDGKSATGHTHAGVYEPANANIQVHVAQAHAPANAQANADITKAEIEAKLIGVISSHSHAGGGSPTGVVDDMQISILQSDGTLNAALGVQTWAGTNKTAQDAFTLVANKTYMVRGKYYINTGTTTHTTAMAFALSGATVVDFQYQAMLWSAAANGIATVQSTVHVTGVASKVLNATAITVYTIIDFEGIIVTGTGGTITPQINFSANPTGTNLMKRGSFVAFTLLGADTMTVAGGWA